MEGQNQILYDKIIAAIKECYDPEIPVNIYDLGLIYEVNLSDEGQVDIVMTLTSPMCPVAESLPMEVQDRVKAVGGVKEVDLQVVFDPPWEKEMMSEEAKFMLDMF
jgi:FeS assembly SUF system protein